MIKLMLLASLLLGGCANFTQFTQALNERELTSCIKYQGSMRVAGGHVAISGVTATGGAKIQDCQNDQ